MTRDHDIDDDLRPIAQRLRDERPEAGPIQLDAIKQRVHARAARRRPARSGLRSRVAIIATLALGVVFSTSGAGLAISGFASSSDKASTAQYSTQPPPSGGVLGESQGGGSKNNNGSNNSGGSNPAQPTRQVENGAQGNSGNQLPFTGFAAIPVLIAGVALLGTGIALRRGSDEPA
jgi:hypothetical protein